MEILGFVSEGHVRREQMHKTTEIGGKVTKKILNSYRNFRKSNIYDEKNANSNAVLHRNTTINKNFRADEI